jgi:hypothetical protein
MLAPSNGISSVRHDLDDGHFSPFSATTTLTPLFKCSLEMFKPIPDAPPVTMQLFLLNQAKNYSLDFLPSTLHFESTFNL